MASSSFARCPTVSLLDPWIIKKKGEGYCESTYCGSGVGCSFRGGNGGELAAVARSGWLGYLKREEPARRVDADEEHQVEDSDRRPRSFVADRLGQQNFSDHRDRR
jgi:hypothetical protein